MKRQVLDPRTRLILFKLLNKGFLATIDGCLSTGKEVKKPTKPKEKTKKTNPVMLWV
jgi:serine/threonine-protein kinase RIO1